MNLPRRLFVSMLGLCAFGAAVAETTPLNQTLVEEKEISITCELAQAPKAGEIPIFSSPKEADNTKGTYHYKLWLPQGYLAEAQQRWPCLFIASPGGNAQMGNLARWLKANKYVVVMLVESKNGPWEAIVGNFLAAHDDVVRRVRIQEGLKFATGMSGGARASSLFVQCRPGFSGLIMQGAGPVGDAQGNYFVAGLRKNPSLSVAMTMGESDSNKFEVARMKSALGGSKFLALSFKGGHEWAPTETIERALDWIENQALNEGPPNPALKSVYLQRARKQFDKLQALTVPWDRYKLADSLLTFSRNRGLAMEAALAPQLRDLQVEVAKLRVDPAVGKEIQAADALHRLEQTRDHIPAAKFANDCHTFAKQFSGTEAATKALEWVDPAK